MNNTETETELKPCPFCGGAGTFNFILRDGSKPTDIDGYDYYYSCLCCAAEGPWERTKPSAFKAWNTRSIVPEREERIVAVTSEMQRELCCEAWAEMVSRHGACHSADIKQACAPTLSAVMAAMEEKP